jgi:amino acid transporter
MAEVTAEPKQQPDKELNPDLQGSSEEQATTDQHRNFGTFGGVFTPTLLTILGVIMYLRTGWVMGNAGIFGGLVIILLAFAIAAVTGLSMSSITTNIRIGAGGAYAIICQSLGLEVGGAVGIPRYLSQALAVTMYIFGFREGWLYIFPGHSAILVDVITLIALFGIAYVSADLAIKTEYVIMAIIAGSLISVLLAAVNGSMTQPLTSLKWWGPFAGSPANDFSGTDFWKVFAVFFPAATGIMAGANMSGDLEDPRRAIPLGTMWAIGVSLVVYLLLAYWLARSATTEELTSNYYVMMDKAYWSPIVNAGLLGACFSSALASIVGAARILQAMGNHGIVPASGWLEKLTKKGEPRNAMLVTGGIVLVSVMLRDLNALAPLITLFFLITYLMLNIVLFVEQSLGLVSFRPLLRIPRWVSFAGTVGCLIIMFIVNPTFSLISIAVTAACYLWLVRIHLDAPFEDVRSGLFVSIAEWAATLVQEDLPATQERAWKPNLLVPISDAKKLRGTFTIIEHLTAPNGSIKIVGLPADGQGVSETARNMPGADVRGTAGEAITRANGTFRGELHELMHAFRERGVFASWTTIQADSFADGLIAGMQALRGAFFKPNVVFLNLSAPESREAEYRRIVDEAENEELGTVLYAGHPDSGLGRRQRINVWIHDRSPDWDLTMDIGNLNLPLLTAYKLQQNWNAKMRLIMVVENPDDREKARGFLRELKDAARMPHAKVIVEADAPFGEYVREAPRADVNVFGLLRDPNFDFIRRMMEETGSTCLFVRDSGRESALA